MLCKVKPYEGTEPYLFFSYCHKNAAEVYPIIERMVADGYRIWYDDGIHPGSDWLKVIADHLSGSAGCIACITPESTCSHNCKSEINLCLELGKPLLAIKLKDFALTLATKLQLGAIQYVEKHQYANEDAFYEKMYSADFLAGCLGPKPDPIPISKPVVVTPEKPKKEPKVEPKIDPVPIPVTLVDPVPANQDAQLKELKAKLAELNDDYRKRISQEVEAARKNVADQVETEKQTQLENLKRQLMEEQKGLIEVRSQEIEEKYAAQLDAEKKNIRIQQEAEIQKKRSQQADQLRQETNSAQQQKIQVLDQQLEEQRRNAMATVQSKVEEEIAAEKRAVLEKETQKIEDEKNRKLAEAHQKAEEEARIFWEEELRKLEQRVAELKKQMLSEASMQIEHDAQEAMNRVQEELARPNNDLREEKLAHIVKRLDQEQAETRERAVREITESCGAALQQNLKALDEKLAEEVRIAQIQSMEQLSQRIEALRSRELSHIHDAAEENTRWLWEQKSVKIIDRFNVIGEMRMDQAAKDAETQITNAWNLEKQELEKRIEALQQKELDPDDDATIIVQNPPQEKENHNILVDPASGRIYRLEAAETKIGRSVVSCDIVFPEDGGLSRHHATVICYQDKVYIKDAGAANGTYINGVRMEPGTQILLESNTWIRMHNVELFYFSGSLAERILETKRLFTLLEEGKRTHIVLDGEDLVLGRSREPRRGCFQDAKISRKHAILSNREDGMYIKDISKNGTYVNDVRLESQVETPLSDGAVLRMGDTVLGYWIKQLTEGDEEA